MDGRILIIFGFGEGVVGVSEHSVLGVILGKRGGYVSSNKKVIVFFREMSLGQCSSLSLVVSVHSFFKPVSNEGA